MSERQPGPVRGSDRDRFVGEGIVPEDASFDAAGMAGGAPGLPRSFSWRGASYRVLEVLETWKESGDCHHGSGERYVRKHWFRIRTAQGTEMKIYFERQKRSSGGSRWRLFSVRVGNPGPREPFRASSASQKCLTEHDSSIPHTL